MPFLRYLLFFLLLPAIAYLAAFPLVRSSAYPTWRGRLWGPMLDFAFEPGQQNADVVIFGDSSAFIGVDPRVINGELGIKSIVLPETIGSLPVTGDLALERYLARNSPPRLLVLYFSPWNLDYTQTADVHRFEGEEMMFRHGDAHEIAAFVLQHPFEALVFPFRLYNTYGGGMLRSLLHREHSRASLAGALGHMDDTDLFPPLKDSCTIPAKLVAGGRQSSVQALVDKYSARLPVLVYMAPIPGCANAAPVLRWNFSRLHAAAPAELPPPDFLGDPYFAHIEPPAVPDASRILAEAIRQRLTPQPAERAQLASQ